MKRWLLELMHIIIFLRHTLTMRNYCEFGENHTMCRFEDVQGVACPGEDRNKSLSISEKIKILEKHNEFRSSVAKGEKEVYDCPPAANMVEMAWDNELELLAKRYAKQCIKHEDLNRRVERFQVSQICYFMLYPGEVYLKDLEEEKELDLQWTENLKYMSVAIIDGLTHDNKTESLVQILRADTKYVGCARHVSSGKQYTLKLMVCNYAPAANLTNIPVYRKGKTCSSCPSATFCQGKYEGLCTNRKTVMGYNSSFGKHDDVFTALVGITSRRVTPSSSVNKVSWLGALAIWMIIYILTNIYFYLPSNKIKIIKF